MRARPGDRLVLRGRHGGDPERDGEIIEVRDPRGGPPYLVRWGDSGHIGFVYPGSDAYVQHLADDPVR